MSWIKEAAARLRGLARRGRADEEIEQELRFHLEMLEEQHRRNGLGDAEARRAARLDLGRNAASVADSWRDQRSIPSIEMFLQDVRYGLRILRRSPGFALAAIITLALGVGANTAIFSIVDTVLLRPLPYSAPDQLVAVGTANASGAASSTGYTTALDWRARSRSFQTIVLMRSWMPTLVERGEAERLPAVRVSASFFEMLGASPALGRLFTEDEDRPDQWRVVLLSDSLWRRRFGADPHIVGRTITMNETPYRVIGVMRADFEALISARYYKKAELWAPLGYAVSLPSACRGCQHLRAIGRLRAGVTASQAAAELNGIQEQMRREFPGEYSQTAVVVTPLKDAIAGDVKPALWVLSGAVAFVLLIACANVANLLLARAVGRQRELAVRTALGAGRGRLVRQLLTENLLLTGAGAIAGVYLAHLAVRALVATAPVSLPRLDQAAIDARVLLFAASTALATGILFGLIPALRGSGMAPRTVLATDTRTTVGGAGKSRAALVVLDLALALVLLAGAGVMLRTVSALLRVDPGFDAKGVLTLQFSLIGPKWATDASVLDFQQRLLTRVRALPGVESAALAGQVPFGGNGDTWGFHVYGRIRPNPSEDPDAERYSVTPEYFASMRIPLRTGRLFSEADTTSSEPVIVVTEQAVRTIWGGESPLGARVRIGDHAKGPWRTVVGVVGDVNHEQLGDPPRPAMYLPQSQNTDSFLVLTAKTSLADPSALAASIRAAMKDLDPTVPVYDVAQLSDLVAKALAERRFVMQLLSAFALLAVVLAAVGLYGVIAYTVTQRTREVGVRVALGASASDICALLLKGGAPVVLAGLGVGVIAAAIAVRALGTLVARVRPLDPIAFAGAVALLIVVALAAHWIPLRRAMRTDPAIALRGD